MKQTKIKIQYQNKRNKIQNLLNKPKTIEMLRNNLFRNTTLVLIKKNFQRILGRIVGFKSICLQHRSLRNDKFFQCLDVIHVKTKAPDQSYILHLVGIQRRI